MTWLWFFFAAGIIFYLLPKGINFYMKESAQRQTMKEQEIQQKEIEDHTFIVRCHGGICDGHEHQITMPERPAWYISPYMPTDEQGMPEEENRVGYLNNMHFFRPNFAYYQQVDDENYFYVRDITDAELQRLVATGDLPNPEEPEDVE